MFVYVTTVVEKTNISQYLYWILTVLKNPVSVELYQVFHWASQPQSLFLPTERKFANWETKKFAERDTSQ